MFYLHGGDRGRRVGVGVERQNLGADEILHERQGASRGHIVAVGDGTHPERAQEGGIGPDHVWPDVCRELGTFIGTNTDYLDST